VTQLISTEQTETNIVRVLEILAETPRQLTRLSQGRPTDALRQPLAPGERSFTETVAHILNCDERASESIYAALVLREPLVLPIHPERQWGKLLRYDQCESAALLAYFTFRRASLLRVIGKLTPAQWGRVVREEGKARQESVYWLARGMALHELAHLGELETRLR
jgi:hypothetical protein